MVQLKKNIQLHERIQSFRIKSSNSLKSFFTADIRNLDVFIQQVPEIPALGIDTMKKIVKKLKFNYKPDTFENPFQRVSARFRIFVVCLG